MSYLTTGQAAAKLGVSDETVRSYFESGRLTGHVLPSGQRRIDADSVDRVKVTRTQVSSTVTVIQAGE
jgi:excisionase family DNA binding protein